MHNLARLALPAIAFLAAAAHADDGSFPEYSFSGFGTLGVVHSSERLADFTSESAKPFGAGFTRSWSAEVDSLIAGQVTARLTPQVSAVLQVIAEQNYDHSYRPHVEWANIRYQVTPDFDIRVGRTQLPLLMYADALKVHYAVPWVRPPTLVYDEVSVTSSDGIDVAYRIAAAGGINTFQVTAGREDSKFPGGATAQARKLVTLVDTYEQGFATVRMSYGRADITLASLDPLFDAFRQFGPEGEAIADKYRLHDLPVTFGGVGVSYDPGAWFVMGEWVRIKGKSILGTKSAWYGSAGWRIGKFTPYLTYARATADNLFDPGLTVSALPPELAGPAMGLNAALNASLISKVVQSTVTIGTRWDFMRKAALKLQFDRVSVGSGSTGTFRNLQPGYQLGGKVNLFSAAVDFTF
jgi:hypothetical protein